MGTFEKEAIEELNRETRVDDVIALLEAISPTKRRRAPSILVALGIIGFGLAFCLTGASLSRSGALAVAGAPCASPRQPGWEKVGPGVTRLPVAGGWLYRRSDRWNGTETVTFVPDAPQGE